MVLLTCGMTKSLKMLLFIAFPAFWLVSFVCLTYLMNDQKQALNYAIQQLLQFTGKLSCGIFEISSFYYEKRRESYRAPEKEEKHYSYSKITLMQSPFLETMRFKKSHFLVLALVPIFEIISIFWNSIIKYTNQQDYLNVKYQYKGFQIIPTALFYQFLIAQSPLYRHHYLSIAMIALALIMITLQYIVNQPEVMNSFFIAVGQNLCIYTTIAMRNIIEKWIVDCKLFSVYKFCFYQGVIGLSITTVTCICLSLIPSLDTINEVFTEGFSEGIYRVRNEPILWLWIVLDICMECGYNIFVLLIIKHYSPVHKSICETAYTFVLVFYSLIMMGFQGNIAVVIVSFCVILAFSLLFNEIVIVHCCKLNEYTHREISIRGGDELHTLNASLTREENRIEVRDFSINEINDIIE